MRKQDSREKEEERKIRGILEMKEKNNEEFKAEKDRYQSRNPRRGRYMR